MAVGAGDIVKSTTLDSTDPSLFVRIALYLFPLSPITGLRIRFSFIAPGISIQVVPASELISHWMDGVGIPDAPTVNTTSVSSQTF